MALKLGLIGAGAWGRNFIHTVAEIDAADLVLVASTNPDTVALLPAGCEITGDYRAAAAAGGLAGVIISTPAESHFDLARAALEAGNPVLVEKPLALDPAEAHTLVELAGQADLPLLVDHIDLFNPAFRGLKERLVDLGGPPAVTSIHWRAGRRMPLRDDTNVLWDWGPHGIALCLDLLGQLPEGATAKREPDEAEGMAGEAWRARLEFPGGRRADLEFSSLFAQKARRLEVRVGNTSLIYDDLASEKLTESLAGGRPCPLPHGPERPLAQVVLHFCDLIHQGGHNEPEARLAADVVDVLTRLDATVRR